MHKSSSGGDFATTPALPSTAAGLIGSVSSHFLLPSLPSLLSLQLSLVAPTRSALSNNSQLQSVDTEAIEE